MRAILVVVRAGDKNRVCGVGLGWRTLSLTSFGHSCHSRAFCSCRAPASSGTSCHASWAAPARPAGVACATGSRPASGRPCTACSWRGCTAPSSSTGAEPPWTAPAWPPKKGRGDRPEPHRPRSPGQQAARRRGRARHTARRRPERGQPARQHDAHRDPGCGAARPLGQARPATAATRQAARRQGLRSSPLPEGMPRARHRAPDCPARRRGRRAPLGWPRPAALRDG